MPVRIYRPSKSAMQSGRFLRKSCWILEFDSTPDGRPDHVMGWPQGSDTHSQLCLKFSSCERAITFAKKRGWDYEVLPENYRQIKPKTYADNFKCTPCNSKN